MKQETTENQFPKLRAIDARPLLHGGRPSILLRDPLQLCDNSIVIPRQLGPVLALCDGTRDVGGLSASLAVRYGLRADPALLTQLVAALDEALLLENESYAQARARSLAEYRQAPFRPPTSAGRSYPADPDELRRMLGGYLSGVQDAIPNAGDARGLVCPHIDYSRGGSVYAQTWKPVTQAAREADLVVLLGTDHFGDGGLVTLTRQHYATPFGVLPTAVDVVDALAEAVGRETAFAGELAHRSEHSIELAAVWLHHVREGKPCELLPVLCGSFAHFAPGELESDPTLDALVATLRQATARRRALVVAAGDLAHVGPSFGGSPVDLMGRARLKAADDELIERTCAGDAAGFFAAIERVDDRHNVCGLPPIYLTLRTLSPVEGERVAYDLCPADQNGASLVSVCGIILT
ncbi:MAG: AmmeMemoRadiSam system protein B [Chloroflexi bacterium]|nr:MAG: AmmeMemoRadiSam system protein B [Chloroflexota bacterium]RLC81520.1 MAG: AmmeMemoRadiSam system protein B [Chloroflexota bacterium]